MSTGKKWNRWKMYLKDFKKIRGSKLAPKVFVGYLIFLLDTVWQIIRGDALTRDFPIVAGTLLPVVLVFISIETHGLRFTKAKMLLPLDGEEKVDYRKDMYHFCCILHFILLLFFHGLVMLVTGFNWYSFLLLFLNDILFATYNFAGSKEHKMTMKGGALGILFLMQYTFIQLIQSEPDLFWVEFYLLLVLYGTVEVPLYYHYRKEIKRELENNRFYE